MLIQFSKMHGLGNDFVVIDAINQAIDLSPSQIRQIADRHFGIGCDQLLLVKPARGDADFRYEIFNADGSEVNQCGNGARCFARFVAEKGLTDQTEIRVETGAGDLVLHLEADQNVTVNMGIPRFAPTEVPINADQEQTQYSIYLDQHPIHFTALSMGNPHAVLTVPNAEMAAVNQLGPLLESHPLFPERVNVGFMQVIESQHIRLRVYERGAGETLACGSGACAAVVSGIELGKLVSPVTVDLKGGTLNISWQGRGQPVIMSGPAEFVFEGTISI